MRARCLQRILSACQAFWSTVTRVTPLFFISRERTLLDINSEPGFRDRRHVTKCVHLTIPTIPLLRRLPLLFLLHFLYSNLLLLLLFVNSTVSPSLRADLTHNSRMSIPADILASTSRCREAFVMPILGASHPDAIACSQYQVSLSPAAALKA